MMEPGLSLQTTADFRTPQFCAVVASHSFNTLPFRPTLAARVSYSTFATVSTTTMDGACVGADSAVGANVGSAGCDMSLCVGPA